MTPWYRRRDGSSLLAAGRECRVRSLRVDANVLVLPSIKEPAAASATTDVAFTTHVQVGLKF